jgi:hypothetical protein
MNKQTQIAINNLIQGNDVSNSANFLRNHIDSLEKREAALIRILEGIQRQSRRASATHDKNCMCGLCDIKQHTAIILV